jgi:hypothetical protein
MSPPTSLRVCFARCFTCGFALSFASPPSQTGPISHCMANSRAAVLPTSLRHPNLRT